MTTKEGMKIKMKVKLKMNKSHFTTFLQKFFYTSLYLISAISVIAKSSLHEKVETLSAIDEVYYQLPFKLIIQKSTLDKVPSLTMKVNSKNVALLKKIKVNQENKKLSISFKKEVKSFHCPPSENNHSMITIIFQDGEEITINKNELSLLLKVTRPPRSLILSMRADVIAQTITDQIYLSEKSSLKVENFGSKKSKIMANKIVLGHKCSLDIENLEAKKVFIFVGHKSKITIDKLDISDTLRVDIKLHGIVTIGKLYADYMKVKLSLKSHLTIKGGEVKVLDLIEGHKSKINISALKVEKKNLLSK